MSAAVCDRCWRETSIWVYWDGVLLCVACCAAQYRLTPDPRYTHVYDLHERAQERERARRN